MAKETIPPIRMKISKHHLIRMRNRTTTKEEKKNKKTTMMIKSSMNYRPIMTKTTIYSTMGNTISTRMIMMANSTAISVIWMSTAISTITTMTKNIVMITTIMVCITIINIHTDMMRMTTIHSPIMTWNIVPTTYMLQITTKE